MLMTTNIKRRPVYRFITWCTLFAFFVNIISYSVSAYDRVAVTGQKQEYSIGALINSLMNLLASEAEANDFETGGDLATGGAPNINAFTGAFSYSYPIQVPPGRGGLAPQLSLSYTSTSQDGWLGLGWDLPISSIERETKFGEPDYDDDDMFIMKLMGASLKFVKEGSEYRLKDESAFLKIEKSGDYWEAKDKSGTTYRFGYYSNSKLDGGFGTFRWYLDSMKDANGNEVTFTYYQDTGNNQVYPLQIDYDLDNHIVFVLEDRTDIAPMYNIFIKVKTAKRLQRIEVYNGGLSSANLVRKYELDYTYSPASDRSRLETIDHYGQNGIGPLTTSFGWQDGVNDFINEGEWENAYGYWYDGSGPARTRPMDVNGDGKTDIVLGPRTNGDWYGMLSEGDEFVDQGSWENAYSDWSTDSAIARTRQMDVNGDGMMDIVMGPKSTGEWYVMLGTENGLENSGEWENAYANFSSASSRIRPMDVNGDGKSDIVLGPKSTGEWYVMLGTENGFDDRGEWENAYGYWYEGSGPARIRAADVNGDGKTDIVLGPRTNGDWYVMLSTGHGFEDQGVWANAYSDWATDSAIIRTRLMDVNGDAKADVVLGPKSTGEWYVMLSTGDSFENQGEWITAYAEWSVENTPARIAAMDANGDGLGDIVLGPKSTGEWYCMTTGTPDNYPDIINTITTPLGATTTVEYCPSSEWENDYLPFKIQTVKSVTTSDNVSHSATQIYEYAGGKYDPEEREFRGFEEVVVTDEETGLVTESHYLQDAIYQGRLASSLTTDSADNEVISTVNTWDNISYGNDRYFAYIDTSVVSKYDEDGDFLVDITTEYEYDNYGNLELEHKQTSDGINRYTRTEYNNDITDWIIGKPNNIRIAESGDPDTSGTVLRETNMEYVSGSPWLLYQKKLVHWEDSVEYEYITTYGYDSYGNVTSETDPRNPSWVTTINYDASSGMFPNVTTNALGHTITRTFDPAFGVMLTETDPNGQVTEYDYDEFGRKDYITYPDGSIKDFTYHIEADNHYVIVQASEMPTTTAYYDNFGRNIKSKIYDGTTTVWTKTEYDDAGRVWKESLPYYTGDTIYWTINEYDSVRGYLEKQTNPDGTYTTISQDGFEETITDEEGNSKTITKDSLGRLTKVEEPTGGITEYTYDIFDNLLTVEDPLDSMTYIDYDDLGRKISMDDPYMGHWEYDYDENGNLVWQKDAENQEVTITYDALNRIDLKTYDSDNREVDYVYDEEVVGYYNIGGLTTIETEDNSVVTSIVEYNYDEMGRQVNEARTIDSVDYVVDREYDLAGRLEYIIYPDNERYDYNYHDMGYLEEVVDHDTEEVYADFSGHNALGQLGSTSYKNGAGTEYFYYEDGSYRLEDLITTDGNGDEIHNLHYTFDDVGNIKTINAETFKEDPNNNHIVNYSFYYDEVYRLTDATATCTTDADREYNQGYEYDLAGNMTSKTGIGEWDILEWEDSVKHIRPTSVRFYEEVSGVANRNIVHNQDNKPVEITYDGGTTTYLTYDGGGNRIKKVQGSETVIYVGDIYEIRDGQAISYVYANGKKVVTLTGTHEYYTHTDHLGSTTVITDENGNAVEEIGYLPFGATLFRNVYNGGTWESAYRFTGQEFDPEYHLYNYGARLYDPIMCRFITPDTIVPDWTNPQTLNRYSYCNNNPLIYVDPSGHLPFLGAVFLGALLGGSISAVTGGNILEGMLCGAISGGFFFGAGSLAAGKSALFQTLTHAGAGAVSGGINAAITGGNILQGMGIGAFSAGVAKGLNIGSLHGRMALGALSGGLAAELAGGSFADGAFQGAWTSAFAFLFNDVAHKVWAGFGKPQYEQVEGDNSNTRFNYLKRKTNFVKNPSFNEFKEALKKYEVAMANLHAVGRGDKYVGLQFSDGIHKLSELNPSNISAKIVGIASCFNLDVQADWNSLNISPDSTTYLDLSAPGPSDWQAYERNFIEGTKNICDAIHDYLNP